MNKQLLVIIVTFFSVSNLQAMEFAELDLGAFGMHLATIYYACCDDDLQEPTQVKSVTTVLEEEAVEKKRIGVRDCLVSWYASLKKDLDEDSQYAENGEFFTFLPLWFLR